MTGEAPTFAARYSDGETAAAREVSVRVEDAGLRLCAEGIDALWRWARLRAAGEDGRGGRLRLRCDARGQGPRLSVEDPDGRLRDILLNRARQALPRRAPWPITAGRAAAFALLSLVFASLVYAMAPRAGRLAVAAVPPDFERALGERVYERLEEDAYLLGARCAEGPNAVAGQAALDALVAEIAAVTEPGFPITAEVRDTWAPNAFALPGERIFITSALIADMESPDALAGVIAHEIGHVRERHAFSGILTQAGVAVSVAMVAGGGSDAAGARVGRWMTRLSYSRAAEREADAVAREALAALELPIEPLAALFETFAGGADLYGEDGETAEDAEGRWTAVLSTHPEPLARARELRDASASSTATRTALNPEEWAAIQNMCAGAYEYGPLAPPGSLAPAPPANAKPRERPAAAGGVQGAGGPG